MIERTAPIIFCVCVRFTITELEKSLMDNISDVYFFCILRGKKFEKRHIELFTDLSSPVSEDQLEIIIANLKKTGISLQFL